jgi:hypothetical protein
MYEQGLRDNQTRTRPAIGGLYEIFFHLCQQQMALTFVQLVKNDRSHGVVWSGVEKMVKTLE